MPNHLDVRVLPDGRIGLTLAGVEHVLAPAEAAEVAHRLYSAVHTCPGPEPTAGEG